MDAKTLEGMLMLKYNSKQSWIGGAKRGAIGIEKKRKKRTRVDDSKFGEDIRKEGKSKRMKRTEGICFAGEEFDSVRSRHSTREGGGTSARWRWRVACLATGCPRHGASYDKADRLIQHLLRQPACAKFWREKIGDRLDSILHRK